MRFDTKIAIVLRDDLAAWQRLNVTAFTASGIAGGLPEVMGEPYQDGSGTLYLPMFRQPVTVLEASAPAIGRACRRAQERGLKMAIFTEDLFRTGNDTDNRAAVRAVAQDDLALVGFAVHGDRKVVDKALDGLKLHP